MISTRKFSLTNDWQCPRYKSALPKEWVGFLRGNGLNLHRECLLSMESKNLLGSFCALPTEKLSSTRVCDLWKVQHFLYQGSWIPGARGSGGHLTFHSLLPVNWFGYCSIHLSSAELLDFHMKTYFFVFIRLFWPLMWSIAFRKERDLKPKENQPKS